MKEEGDPWRAHMDETLASLDAQIDEALKPWSDAGEEAEKLVAAAQGFSGAAIIAQIRGGLSDVEVWYRQQMDEFAMDLCKEMGIPFAPRFSDRDSGWLTTGVQAELSAMTAAVSEFGGAAMAYAEFANEHSGFTGFLKEALGAYVNPVEGLAGLVGESSTQKEGRQVAKRVNAGATRVNEAQIALLTAIDHAVVTRWNSKAEEARDKIAQAKEEAESARTAKPTAGIRANAAPSARRNTALAVVLAVLLLAAISAGTFMAVAHHNRSNTNTQQPGATQPALITLPKDTRVRKGPATTFGGLAVLEEETHAVILDKSVPGWTKVRTEFGLEGWIENGSAAK